MKALMKYWLIAIASITILAACTSTKSLNVPSPKEPILFSLGNQMQVPVSEFRYVYEKSIPNKDSLYTEKSLRDYLELFINYKLKILEAQAKGADTTQAFRREFATYEEQLAMPYLIAPQMVDSLTHITYQRLQEDLRGAHILLKISPDAAPADTLRAYQEMSKIRQRAVAGEDFGNLAREFSQDPSAAENAGDLGWFTALQMVYAFETAAYETPAGQISPIVRTQYGYHIIKIAQRRRAIGTTRVAHIMIQVPRQASAEDGDAAKRKIDEIHSRLQRGDDWAVLCSKYSEDATSKDKAGELEPFKVGQVLPEMEDACLGLTRAGEYTTPVRTSYGWHIFRLIERVPLESYAKLLPSLKQEVTRETRLELLEDLSIAQLRKVNQVLTNNKLFNQALEKADARLTRGEWSYNSLEPLGKQILLKIKSTTPNAQQLYSVNDFFAFAYLRQAAKPDITDAKHYMRVLYEQFVKECLLQFERKNLRAKRPEYRNLMQEFRDGILMFGLMQEKIYERSFSDTTGLRNYFNTHRNDYQWGQRVTATVYRVANEAVMQQLKPYLNQRLYPVRQPIIAPLVFEKDSYAQTEPNLPILRDVSGRLRIEPLWQVELVGHQDPTEKKGLSADRLKYSADYLVYYGIARNRIQTKDFGASNPISKTDRAKNRRVDINLYSPEKKYLERIINDTNPLNLKITEGVFSRGDNEWVDKADWNLGDYYFAGKNGEKYLVQIADIKAPRFKEYDEARGYVITDYQKFLEVEWVKELRQRYPVTVNEAEVKQLIKR